MKKVRNIKKYCTIVPAYNAKHTISEVIKSIHRIIPGLQITVVDDGSTDGTASIVSESKSVILIPHKSNLGKGAAIKTGIRYAKEAGFQYGIFIDADMQHDPEKIVEFICLREKYNSDMILGKRSFLRTDMPFHRMLSNSITSFMISIRTGKRVHDSQCGYRLIKLSNLNPDIFDNDGFQFESEIIIKMLYLDANYCEIPIPTIYNNAGSSINNLLDTLRFIKLFLYSYLWF
ncbi:glycosyltransferase family 2 protein [bacterium]|nr:glycosyltransferase family 2 protein [bacterium]